MKEYLTDLPLGATEGILDGFDDDLPLGAAEEIEVDGKRVGDDEDEVLVGLHPEVIITGAGEI